MSVSRKRRGPPVTPRVVANIRAQLDDLRRKHHGFDGHGYVVVNTIGPYDHNPYDYPLPDADFPKVFLALYEAVDFAQKMHKQGLNKLKIDRLDGSLIPRTQVLASQVVWRSWTPGEHGGWARSRTRSRVAARDTRVQIARRRRPRAELIAREVREMTALLKKAGYHNPALSARKLSREGIGPGELVERLRMGKSGVGSLPYTHGFTLAHSRDAGPASHRHHRPPPLPSGSVRTMTAMLTKAGYPRPASSAQRLAAEGIGPAELAFRLKVDTRPPARSKTRKKKPTRRRVVRKRTRR